MMDDYRARLLFKKVVEDKIRYSEPGIIELPLSALREFHDMMGLDEDEKCRLGFSLAEGEDGFYNYVWGNCSDKNASVVLADVYFCDYATRQIESIYGGELFNKAVCQSLYSGEALISGFMYVDQDGEIIIQTMISETIGAEFYLMTGSHNEGFHFLLSDMSRSYHVWSDGDTFYIALSLVACYSSLLS